MSITSCVHKPRAHTSYTVSYRHGSIGACGNRRKCCSQHTHTRTPTRTHTQARTSFRMLYLGGFGGTWQTSSSTSNPHTPRTQAHRPHEPLSPPPTRIQTHTKQHTLQAWPHTTHTHSHSAPWLKSPLPQMSDPPIGSTSPCRRFRAADLVSLS